MPTNKEMEGFLSPHFTLVEATCTSTGINNAPPSNMLAQLIKTACHMEIVRAHLSNSNCVINSWYRSPAVNSAVGGSSTSAHLKGYAVDFTCATFGTPEQVVQKLRGLMQYDQLIWEHPKGRIPWVHISFDPRFRGQVLEFHDGKYTTM